MGFLDTIVDIFNRGPDDWRGRMSDRISLISPDGTEIEASWRGDSREAGKKLGIFEFPGIKGNIVQDLRLNSVKYSIPLYFSGKDCDRLAQRFAAAAGERGVWTVTHPVHGFHELQLVSYKETTDLVTNGGYILVETDWIEPIDETSLQTAAELAGLLDGDVDELNITAAEQFAEDLKATTEALQQDIARVSRGIQNLSDAALGPLFSVVDSLDNLVLAVQRGLQDTLQAAIFEPLSLAGQIQQLIQLPMLGANDLVARLDYYDDLSERLLGTLPAAATAAARNALLVTELALLGGVAARAKIATTGISAAQSGRVIAPGRVTAAQVATGAAPTSQTLPGTGTFSAAGGSIPVTREQAVSATLQIVDDFASSIAALESAQSNFLNNSIDLQFFATRRSYPVAAKLVARTARFLLLSSFDMAVERRIVLAKPRSPIEIVVTEYGTLGPGDMNLDFFIWSNELSGREVYLLPAGREVVIYA